MAKYRKKPVVIDAIQFTGSNWGEIETFVPVGKYNDDGTFQIVTLEGEFYPCKPDIFEQSYEQSYELA